MSATAVPAVDYRAERALPRTGKMPVPREVRTWKMARGATFRVLGIDPGLNITGYAVVDFGRDGQTIVEAGTLRTTARADMAERIQQIYDDLRAVLSETQPDLAAIEQLYAHYAHPRTAIVMAHARGAVMLACRQASVNVQHLAATRVKKSVTGNGHASKLQVARAIQQLCHLRTLPSPPDVADALAIALCAGRSGGRA
ncbi:MAG: crossover junction endodeoxyribonuclease RuvC [Phycisphaerae bacterium]|nr:crossover junction endodeoxyribonuclease RuvC [Phycisphaerae bacterium]